MRWLWIAPVALLLFPSFASAYSFQTEEFKDLRAQFELLQDDAYEPTSKAQKAALISEFQAKATVARNSLLPVLNAETARLNRIVTNKTAAAEKSAAESIERSHRATNRWCARKKAGKTPAQKERIEAICQKERNQATSKITASKNKAIERINENYGPDSRPRKTLQDAYDRAVAAVNKTEANGIKSINDRPLPTYELQVAVGGEGSVSSSPVGISCGIDCTGFYKEDTEVTLTATADSGWIFSGWSGDASCTSGNTCTLTINSAKNVTATFALVP